jgi:FkbM family methyltransferase
MLSKPSEIARKIRRRSWLGWKMARTYRNWPLAILDRLHLIGPRPALYQLRNRIEFSASTHTYDSYIINEIWIDEVYTSSPGFAIRDNWVVADIGGHKGIFSVFAATRATGVKVYSFEAFPGNFALLSENIRRNNLSNVKAFNVAVGGKDGESTLYIYPDSGQNSVLLRSDVGLQPVVEIKVQTWSLTRVLETINSPVNLMKMDIEGMEYDALLSCPADDLQKVERIALEYHDDFVHTPHRVSELIDFLGAIGFSTHLCSGQRILTAERFPSMRCTEPQNRSPALAR